MPRLTLKTLFSCVTLLAVWIAGLIGLKKWDADDHVATLYPLLIVSWGALGIALVIPFRRTPRSILLGIVLGLLIGVAVFGVDLVFGTEVMFRLRHYQPG